MSVIKDKKIKNVEELLDFLCSIPETIYIWDTCLLLRNAKKLGDVFIKYPGKHIFLSCVEKELRGLKRNITKKRMINLVFGHFKNNEENLIHLDTFSLLSSNDIEADPYLIEISKILKDNKKVVFFTEDKKLKKELEKNSAQVISKIDITD